MRYHRALEFGHWLQSSALVTNINMGAIITGKSHIKHNYLNELDTVRSRHTIIYLSRHLAVKDNISLIIWTKPTTITCVGIAIKSNTDIFMIFDNVR